MAQSISKINLPDGTYYGQWLGYEVRISGHNISFRTDIGLRNTMPARCTIRVKNKIAYVTVNTNVKSTEPFGGTFGGFGFNPSQAYGRAAYYNTPRPIIINTGGTGYKSVSFDGGYTQMMEQDFY